MTSAPFHGKDLDAKWDATSINDVLDWNCNPGGDVAEYVSSDTSGRRGRVDGTSDTTAEVSVLASSSTPVTGVVKKGDTGTLALYENGSLFWSFAAICTDVRARVSAGELVGYTLSFAACGQTGAVTHPTV